jgi:DNA-binding response OmpR family regulator
VEEILLIDDDVELCSMLADYLGRYGFHVSAVHRGDTGLKEALKQQYALILLDVMLPGLDGFEVLKRIRAASSINVLLLTARGDDVDRIVGLEIGADDYLPKPFNPRELLARIRAIRMGKGSSSPTLSLHCWNRCCTLPEKLSLAKNWRRKRWAASSTRSIAAWTCISAGCAENSAGTARRTIW